MIITMIIIIMMTHLPSIQPDLVAAPQQPRQVKRARKAVTTMLKKKFWLEVTHHYHYHEFPKVLHDYPPDQEKEEVGGILRVRLVQAGLNVATWPQSQVKCWITEELRTESRTVC